MIRVLAVVLLLALPGPRVTAQEATRDETRAWPTPGEQRGWFAPTGPVEMAEYLAALADAFEGVSLDTLAWIDGGSVEPDSALPVLLAVFFMFLGGILGIFLIPRVEAAFGTTTFSLDRPSIRSAIPYARRVARRPACNTDSISI